MLGSTGVIWSCASPRRRPGAMDSTTAARFIVLSRAIFPITAKCSTAPAVTLELGLIPSTVDNWPVAAKFLSTIRLLFVGALAQDQRPHQALDNVFIGFLDTSFRRSRSKSSANSKRQLISFCVSIACCLHNSFDSSFVDASAWRCTSRSLRSHLISDVDRPQERLIVICKDECASRVAITRGLVVRS